MREIKFRGRDAYGQYRYGDLWQRKDGTLIYDEVWHRVDPKSVGQFTGGYDAGGEEIYEGDYLEIDFAGAAKVIGDGSLIRDLEVSKPTAEAQLHVEFRSARFEVVWRTHNGCVDTGFDLFYISTIQKFVKVKETTTHGTGTEQRYIG